MALNGAPLADAEVKFERSDGPLEQRIFLARTDDAGRFVMRLLGGGEGVAPGNYRVAIKSVHETGSEDKPAPPDPVPVPFRDGSTAIEVPVEGLKNAEFAMESRRR